MSEHAVDLCDLALRYARGGWRVFPLNGKVPAISGGRGCLDATTDPETIYEWWARYPNANIGIATGEQSGLLVIDLDGPDARRAWLSLVGRHEPFETMTSRTGRADGGLHVLFAFPADVFIPNRPQGEWSARVLGDRKIEVIGEGRYIVAPGSLHASGARYAWEHGSGERSLAPVPAWLLAKLQAPVDKPAPPSWKPRTPADANHARQYVLGALRKGHDAVASLPRGERNAGLVREAYALGGYVPTLELYEIREALWSACAHWPANERDTRKDASTIERGMHAGMASPRSIPEPQRPSARYQEERAPFDGQPLPPQEPAPLTRSWPTSPELALTLADAGPALPSPFATLNDWTRGGLRRGKLVALGGAPGAGKTLLAAQLAHHYYDAGHPVGFYMADEPRDATLVRWGQQCGLVRDDLERADEHTRAALSRSLSTRVDFVDPDEATLEQVIAWMLGQAEKHNLPGVLVVDSLQTARVDGKFTDKKERVDAVVAALKAARNRGLIVITTSEVSRAFYAKVDDRIDPIAAFKESGDIEYALDLALVLVSVKGENGALDVWLPKNRIAPKKDTAAPAFRCSIDFARAKMAEAPPADDSGDGEEYDNTAEVEAAANELIRTIVTTKGAITRRSDLEKTSRRRTAIATAAVSLLLRTGRITGGRGIPFRVVSEGSEC